MKVRLLLPLDCACETCRTGSGGCRDFPDGIQPAGTIFDLPDSYKLVQHGAAESLDDEARAAAGMTEQELRRVQYSQLRTSRGIVPEDFEAYDAGEIIGYYPNGDPKPGPNATHSEGGVILHGWDNE